MFTLPQLLARSAERWPDHPAVRCRGASLSYRQVDGQANALAGAFIDAGIRRGDRIGVYMPKCVEMLPAVYGAMRAGAAYVPLDPKGPPKRAALVASDCEIAALVATPDLAEQLLPQLDPPPVLTVLVGGPPTPSLTKAIGFDDVVRTDAAATPEVGVIDLDLAYILYTSGSTGLPKGVMLTHRNALTFVEWCIERIGVRHDDRLSNHAPLHFDLSVFDLYVAAHAGATVVPVPEEDTYMPTALSSFVRDEAITVWYSVPSALHLLASAASDGADLASLKTVIFAGEVYPTPKLRELLKRIPGRSPWNLYGPTETNVCTYYRVVDVPPDDDRPIPIGRACENTDVFAVADDGSRAEVGEVGELYVRGSTVMKGYWGRPDVTGGVLVDHPLDPTLPERVYRTGDLVRPRPDGDYDFLGRRDHQIKSRGYRIELGEIEAALATHPAVEDAVCVAVPHPEWDKEIASRVVLRQGLDTDPMSLKRHLSERIPRYMIPTRIEFAETLPRTPNGKIDRRRVADEMASR